MSVGDQDDVELIEGLVNKTDIVLLNGRVLSTGIGKFREGREEGFDSRAGDFAELTRKHCFAPAGAYRRSEDNLCGRVVISAGREELGCPSKRKPRHLNIPCLFKSQATLGPKESSTMAALLQNGEKGVESGQQSG